MVLRCSQGCSFALCQQLDKNKPLTKPCVFNFEHEFRICKVKFRHYAFHHLFFCSKYDIIIMSLFV